jgi:NhaP-type Na+/H+ or K+/H+ antiporter
VAQRNRDQESERTRQQLRRWKGKVLSLLESLVARRTSSQIARILVILTLFLWGLILLIGILFLGQPQLAVVPLYAFYPGELVAEKSDYNATLMHAWGAGAGIVCLALAILGTWRRNKTAAIVLMVFFLMSTLISCARIIHGAQTSR